MLFRDEWMDDSDVIEGKAATVISLSILAGQVLSTLIITPVVDFLKDGKLLHVCFHVFSPLFLSS